MCKQVYNFNELRYWYLLSIPTKPKATGGIRFWVKEVDYTKIHYLSSQTEQLICVFILHTKIVSEYDQEIPQSQTADNPVVSRGRAAQPSRHTRKTN